MKTGTVETLAWVLIFAGALLVAWGLFAARQSVAIGGAMIVVGAVAAAAGVVLIVVRSRMQDPTR